MTDDTLVGELPDSAMEVPLLPGLGSAIAILLLVIAHRTMLDPGRRSTERD